MATPKTRDEVIAISNAAADAVGIPRVLLLAAGIAESGLRWNARRPADPSQDERYWTDVSHGVWQQTVRWSDEYIRWCVEQNWSPAQFPGSDVTEAAGAHYYDVEHAAQVAAAQLKPKYKPGESDAVFKALCRYNWPAGDGAPKGQAQAANYRNGIAEAEQLLAPVNEPGPQPVATRFEEYRDPQPSGTFAQMPKGIILHGSRSGKAGNPKQQEYAGTARYEQNNTAGLGWHITCGEGTVAVHLTPKEWGWHALENSKRYLGCEFAQATEGEPITDAQVDAFCDWFKVHVLPVWPGIPLHFPSHAEADREIGVNQGKTDAFRFGDPRMDELRTRILARLKKEDVPVGVPDAPVYSVGEGIMRAMQERGDTPASDEMYTKRGERDEWSEAYGTSGRRYMWLPGVGRLFVYEPAA
jgi:hypothetical protein